jgi:trimeric autotransporter adhesin
VDSTVIAVETTPSGVIYVGGSFTNAYNYPYSGYTVNRIARWDAANGWLPLGTGVGGAVNAVCSQGGMLYVGGAFTTAGGAPANRIAMWDGANWSSLGTGSANGLGGTVNAILADGSDLYVGGSFTTAGGATARAIAKWNGSGWSAVGQGMFSPGTANVYALAKIGTYLYACGQFTNAGASVITRNIARWDGTKWEALGSGFGNEFAPTTSRGFALVASGNNLFVGGLFETAGVCDAGYIACWNDQVDFTPPPAMRLRNPQMLPGNNFRFRATANAGAAYVIEQSEDLRTWLPLATNSLPALDITNSAPGVSVRTYRMREIP